jgi:hypothetical protein
MNDILLDPPPSPKNSNSKATPSAMRQVGITMLALGALALVIGFVISSLVN